VFYVWPFLLIVDKSISWKPLHERSMRCLQRWQSSNSFIIFM